MKKQKNFKKYSEAKKWLLSLIQEKHTKDFISYKNNLKQHKKKLERTKKFLEFLGNPQNAYKSIHIAGTSGKGSTAVILAKLLESSGLKVALHTKPYLQEPIEKLIINSKPIVPSKFTELVKKLKQKYLLYKSNYVKNEPPKYTELWIALTHLYFSEEKVDFGVIEASLGGRFDHSNVLKPEISIITSVGFDHIKQLGPTLKDIAWHKAGIIKENTPVIVGKCTSEALKIIKKEAKEKNAPIYIFEKDFNVKINSLSLKGTNFDLYTPFGNYYNIQLPLIGEFQAHNFALAFVAYKILQEKYKFKPIKHLNKTLKNLTFPGRFEIVQKKPLVILDSAHNPDKIKALSQTLKKVFPKEKIILVLGILSYKDIEETIQPILPLAKKIITTEPNVYRKPPLKAVKLENIIKKISSHIPIYVEPNPIKATKLALNLASRKDIIVITGSLYLVGNARELWYPSTKLLLEAEKGMRGVSIHQPP